MVPLRSSYRVYVIRKSRRLLAIFLAIIICGLGAIFFPGSGDVIPKLGIDLQGGTMVVLTPRTINGQSPAKDQLRQAKDIIESRVNGRGITGAEVVISGNNIQITIPGDDKGLARSLGATAQMFVRPVRNSRQNVLAPPARPTPAKPTSSHRALVQPSKPSSKSSTSPSATPIKPTRTLINPSLKPPIRSQITVPSTSPAATSIVQLEQGYTKEEIAQISAAKILRQATDFKELDATFATYSCVANDPLRGNDDPALPLITCSKDGNTVYELDAAIIKGSDITDAAANTDLQTGQNVVNLNFSGSATTIWGKYTTQHLYSNAAFTLDSQVISAPVIQSSILDGRTQISGNFTYASAQDLAMQLKFGGLPLSFDIGQADTISAILGIASLRAGLIAGLTGLIAILIYSCFYYRLLSILVGISLALSLLLIYIVFVLFGRWIGLTLDLSGIAGLIIGIGMTADSFVVYFERIKDEIRAGRSIRSAVAPAWKRAQHTILSGNAVSFIAAAVLYYLAAGAVRGFAFTLGLTSLLDLVILYLVTDPLMELAVQSYRLTQNPARIGFASVLSRRQQLSTKVRNQNDTKENDKKNSDFPGKDNVLIHDNGSTMDNTVIAGRKGRG